MRSSRTSRWASRAACLAWLLAPTLVTAVAAADEPPSRLGRLFRFGSTAEPARPAPSTSLGSLGSSSGLSTPAPATSFSTGPAGRAVADPFGSPALSTPPTGMAGPGSITPSPRISPKPRVNKAVTEADPLVTRISLGRADGGSQFGMFLQVFADGTVIDGGGVHKIGAEALKPVVEAVGSGEFARIKGHCGGPAGDTFENIHVVTYERAYGKLRANAFSYSGNPQGCDHAVHHLHKVLEDLQLKLDNPGAPGLAAAGTTPVVVNAASPAPAPAAPLPPMSGPAPIANRGPLGMPSLPDPGLH